MWLSCYSKDKILIYLTLHEENVSMQLQQIELYIKLFVSPPTPNNFQIKIMGKIHISTKKGKFERFITHVSVLMKIDNSF